MRRRRLLAPVCGAMMNFACAFFVVFFLWTPVSLAQAEGPSAAADRFYQKDMSMGIAPKPLGDRWFTVRFGAS